ncbi:MAG: RNA pseudouridine synthase [Gammaproteobacteria bacterium]|nr:RNA pseudouridine synthase [Gammaproteobacteria bacterium]
MTENDINPSHFEMHIGVSSPGHTALALLAENTSLSKQKLKSAMANGCVWLESPIGIHRLRRAKKIVHENDTLHLYYDEAIQKCVPVAAELIADVGEYSIWNKPYGMYSQGSKWGDHCTIYRWAEIHLKPQRPAFPVHRLDRAANGLMILAHSKKMATTFSELFKNRKIQKQYRATVEGTMDKLVLPYSITSDIDNKPAHSKIISLDRHDNTTTVIIEIETGRKHQIRKHLSGLGHPIVGDRLYGTGASDKDLQLQSCYLKFICPLTATVREYSL